MSNDSISIHVTQGSLAAARANPGPHDPNDYNTPPPEYTVEVQGKITWDLVWNYDNSDNDGSIVETREYKTEQRVTYSVFNREFSENTRKDLNAANVGAELGASYAGISAKLTSSVESSSEITEALQRTTESKYEGESYTSSTLTQTCKSILISLVFIRKTDTSDQLQSRRGASLPSTSNISPLLVLT